MKGHFRKVISILFAFILVTVYSSIPTALAADASAPETTVSAQISTAVMSVQSAEEATGISAADEGTAYAEGEVIVVYKDGTTQTQATQTVQTADTVTTDAITDDELLASTVDNGTLVAETGGEPMAIVDVADGTTVVQAVAELEQDDNVAYARPNYRYEVAEDISVDELQTEAAEELTAFDKTLTEQSTSINDPSASQQWQLKAISSGSYGVDCYDAWDYARCSGSVGVAVIDTGCLTTHEDLADNVEGAYNAAYAVWGSTYNNDSGTSDVTDRSGHGTHVAGIVAAKTSNNIGGSGVSYNAKIVPVKASCDYRTYNGTTYSNAFFDAALIEAYTYIIKNASAYNIKVINMSLGGPISSESDLVDDALLAKVDAAFGGGILTVCAAGNLDSSHTSAYYEYPGDYATCISVIDTTSSGILSGSSNHTTSDIAAPTSTTSDVNGTKDISAPGTSIFSTLNSDTSSYGYESGTSMATPVVAGVAALVFAANPSLTPAEVKTILYETATDLGDSGWDRTYGWGLVNAAAAVSNATGGKQLIVSERCAVSDVIYNGLEQTPLVVRNAEGTILTPGTDYAVSYEDNTDVGTATATITGVGDSYYGTVTQTFAISPASISSATISSIAAQTYTGSALTPSPTLTFNSKTLTPGTDYTLSYSNNTDAGTATVTVTGKGNFSDSSTASATFVIGPAALSGAGISSIATQTYTGSALTPAPMVSFGGKTLISGTDYTVAYGNNTYPGTATVTVAGKRNFTGAKAATFAIVSAYSNFPDVKSDVAKNGFANVWYVYDGWLDYVVSHELMSGYTSNGNFGPYDNITRGQVAVILYRYDQNRNAVNTDNNVSTKFRDVPSGRYYSAAIRWASETGVVTGYGSTGYTTFGPDDPVTREQLALMIARYVGYKTTGSAVVPSADAAKFNALKNADKVDSWARAGMVYCCANNIIGGVNGNDLAPLDNAWRASMAKMITVTIRDVL